MNTTTDVLSRIASSLRERAVMICDVARINAYREIASIIEREVEFSKMPDEEPAQHVRFKDLWPGEEFRFQGGYKPDKTTLVVLDRVSYLLISWATGEALRRQATCPDTMVVRMQDKVR